MFKFFLEVWQFSLLYSFGLQLKISATLKKCCRPDIELWNTSRKTYIYIFSENSIPLHNSLPWMWPMLHLHSMIQGLVNVWTVYTLTFAKLLMKSSRPYADTGSHSSVWEISFIGLISFYFHLRSVFFWRSFSQFALWSKINLDWWRRHCGSCCFASSRAWKQNDEHQRHRHLKL